MFRNTQLSALAKPKKSYANLLQFLDGFVDNIRDQRFTTFFVESIKAVPARPGTPEFKLSLYKAIYSEEGIILKSMYKVKDGNPKAQQIPTSGLINIGAKQLGCKPKWIFCQKIANDATRLIINNGLKAKFGEEKGATLNKVWIIRANSEDEAEQAIFKELTVFFKYRSYSTYS
jgi:hypothetical protein